jgi:hypothetical protein
MRIVYSYLRLVIASSLFMGGIAFQFAPSPASVARDARWRERQLQVIPAGQHAQWVQDRDTEDARTEAYLRVFGVFLGGIGLGGALLEVTYLAAQYGRRRSADSDSSERARWRGSLVPG